MTRASRCELILGVLTPILAVLGVSILLFAPRYTVNAPRSPHDEGPVVTQQLSAAYLSHGTIFSQYLLAYAGVVFLTLLIAASAVVHARTQARAAVVVLWIASALLWIGTYPISPEDPLLRQTSYIGMLDFIGSFLGGALASAFLACAIAIAVDVRRRPNHG